MILTIITIQPDFIFTLLNFYFLENKLLFQTSSAPSDKKSHLSLILIRFLYKYVFFACLAMDAEVSTDPSRAIFESLYKMYKESNNCDFQLISGDNKKFNAHSFVLYAAIPKLRYLRCISFYRFAFYFNPCCRKAIVESGEKNSGKLRLKEVKGRELELLIEYTYKGECEGFGDENKDVVVELIKAAEYLQMNELEQEMLQIFKDNLNIDLAIKVFLSKE
jgi:hypothetical protein